MHEKKAQSAPAARVRLHPVIEHEGVKWQVAGDEHDDASGLAIRLAIRESETAAGPVWKRGSFRLAFAILLALAIFGAGAVWLPLNWFPFIGVGVMVLAFGAIMGGHRFFENALRRPSSLGRVAADGITCATLFGRRHIAWHDVVDIDEVRPTDVYGVGVSLRSGDRVFLEVGRHRAPRSPRPGRPPRPDGDRLFDAGQLAARQQLLAQRIRELKAAALGQNAGYRDERALVEAHEAEAAESESDRPARAERR